MEPDQTEAPVSPADAAPENLFLTTRDTEAFGAAGRFVELTADEAEAHGNKVVRPTAEQLALR